MRRISALNRFRRHRAGFTLLELLVTIAIILLLIALLLPAIGMANRQRKITLATSQVKDIYAAAQLYYQDFGTYPPDTGTYQGDEVCIEPYSLHRYLGMPVTDQYGRVHGPYMQMHANFLKGPAATVDGMSGVMLFCDPWGTPFNLDAYHVVADSATGAVNRVGVPYPASTPATEKTLDLKVWSNGPDRQSGLGSMAPAGPRGGLDQDNITSWTN